MACPKCGVPTPGRKRRCETHRLTETFGVPADHIDEEGEDG